MRSDKISWSKIWNLTFRFIFTFYTDILHFSFLFLEMYILHKHFKIDNFTILSFYTFYYFTIVYFTFCTKLYILHWHSILFTNILYFKFYTDVLHFILQILHFIFYSWLLTRTPQHNPILIKIYILHWHLIFYNFTFEYFTFYT